MPSIKSILNNAKKAATSLIKPLTMPKVSVKIPSMQSPPAPRQTSGGSIGMNQMIPAQRPPSAPGSIGVNQAPAPRPQGGSIGTNQLRPPVASIGTNTLSPTTSAMPSGSSSFFSAPPSGQKGSAIGEDAIFSVNPMLEPQQQQQQAPDPRTQELMRADTSGSMAARARALGLMTASSEEQRLQNDLISFRESANLGISGLEGQGRAIPLGLIRGEQGKLAEQAGIEERSLIDRLAISTQARQAALQAAQGEVAALTADEQSQQSRLAPFEFNGNLVQLDPVSGELRVIAEAPATVAQPIKLSPGETLLDPTTGEVLFRAQDRAESVPAAIQEYLFASQQGFAGSFNDYKNQAEANKPLSAESAKLISNAQSGLDSIDAMLRTVDKNLGRGVLGGFSNREYKTAQKNLVDVIGRLRSGGAITSDESKTFEDLLPKVIDSDELARTKIANMQRLLTDVISGVQGTASSGQQQSMVDSSSLQPDQQTIGILNGRKNSSGQAISEQQAQGLAQDVTALKQRGFSSEQIKQYLNNELGYGQPSSAGFPSDLSRSQNGSLGSLSEKYESGGDPGVIGYDNTGGYSYGAYQLAHSNANRFIAQSDFGQFFQGKTFNSLAWRNTWKQVAQKYPVEFKAAQKDYIGRTHYQPQMNKLAQAGFNTQTWPQALQDVVWSTAVQHGPATNLIVTALNRLPKNASAADTVRAIYNARWSGGANFARSTPDVQRSVYNRFFGANGELNQALKSLA